MEKNNAEDIDCLPYELNRKLVAEAFWNAECEMELRETNNIGHSFLSVSAREDLMKETDHKRANSTYSHDVCSDECELRGKWHKFIEMHEYDQNHFVLHHNNRMWHSMVM